MLDDITDFLGGLVRCLGMLVLLAFSLGYVSLGVAGIDHHLGGGWALGAVFLALLTRIVLPITIGVFFAVVDAIGWPWWAGLLIAAPGLVLIVPAAVGSVVETVVGWFR